MTVKPPFLDYEPLKRTTSDSVVEDGAESVFKKTGKFGDAELTVEATRGSRTFTSKKTIKL